MKRIVALVLSVLILLPLFGMAVYAEGSSLTGSCGENVIWTYDTSSKTLTISGSGKMKDYFGSCPWADYFNISDVRTLVIEEGVTSIGREAFSFFDALTEIRLASSVASIGELAFERCTALQSVQIPATVTEIGNRAFCACYSLERIEVDSENPNYCNDEHGVLFNKDMTVLKQCPGNIGFFYDIPEGVVVIDDFAFDECSSLVSITIPEGVTEIGNYVFRYCEKLEQVHFPSTLTKIGTASFSDCHSLRIVKLPEHVTEICDFAFYSCENLVSIYCGSELKSVDIQAFKFCPNFNHVLFGGTQEQWEKVKTDDLSIPDKTIHFEAKGNEVAYADNCDIYCKICARVIYFYQEAPFLPKFTDVSESDYFYDAVMWATDLRITNGVSETSFAPNEPCTRGQIVTFLWRANGSPAPMTENNIFTDVHPGDYYYEAVLWAVENGITNGMSETTFEPDSTCTRAQAATFIWRANGKQKPANQNHPFTDVAANEYYYDAVLWAVENGITNGMSATTFEPNTICTRAQIVTFLYRAETYE